MQAFKSIYFADFPSEDASRRNVTLAFAPTDRVWMSVANLTSHEMRGLLGTASYADLRSQASRARLSLNAYCHRRLQESLSTDGASSTLDPVQATFRGGAEDPLQRWFPFLEGYSPSFVSAVLREYAPNATTVYDPFAGVGTTPLTAARHGLTALYSELNPLLQAVTQAKADVLALGVRRSGQVRRELAQLVMSVLAAPDNYEPAQDLAIAYGLTFGKSEYFDHDTLRDVLRLRTWCDEALLELDPITARLAELAVVGALVPSSRLIRAGDLRFRREAEQEETRPIRMLAAERLEQMAEDMELLKGDTPTQSITLISEDVRDLRRLPKVGFDAVVTSPPYLNGTNYFRNTKLELWFLRRLRNQTDLRRYRSKSVVAGINDVSGTSSHEVPRVVASLVSDLEAVAYDRRIPRMVGAYFADMQLTFDLLRQHAGTNSTIAIDIGDSIYAGVRVPTDEIMVRLMKEVGYQVEDRVTLRRRQSRDGSELRQTLLVFRGGKSSSPPPLPRPTAAWIGFRDGLPHKIPPMTKRNWGHPLHSLCSYQGKMKPSLAASLVRAVVRPGYRVLDPFAGVGTIPFEAASLGATTISFEISPAALAITRAKLNPPTELEVETAIAELEAYIRSHAPSHEEIERAASFGLNGSLREYFQAATLVEILSARRFFVAEAANRGRDFVRACLLHVLHGNRPYALSRRSHPITPFAPSGPFEYKSVVESVRAKAIRARYSDLVNAFVPGSVIDQDATAPWDRNVDDLDVIVTSPPFFESTRFHTGNWMRLWFAGWEPEDFRTKPLRFVDERQRRSFDVYKPLLRQSRERLRENGMLVLHLGWSAACDMAEELERQARPWFRRIDRFTEVVDLEGHGISDRGKTAAHQYLVLG